MSIIEEQDRFLKKSVIPTLTSKQKTSLAELANTYKNSRDKMIYIGTATRNDYSSGTNVFDTNNKIKINCSLFVQNVWMGRDISDYLKTSESYSPNISKVFDWGYYFNFKHEDIVKQSKDPNNFPKKYLKGTGMYAYDMAFELYQMGCEIPFSEADIGDIVFCRAQYVYPDTTITDPINDHYYALAQAFRNIDHVAIITNKFTNSFGVTYITYMEGTNAVLNGTNIPISQYSTHSSWPIGDRRRAVEIERRICMVARHPAAFGKASNVPNIITAI